MPTGKLSEQFSRARFVEDRDAQERCNALAAALTERLLNATHYRQAVQWIRADLVSLGHAVTEWEGVLSDAWTQPENEHYIWIVLDGSDDDDEDNDNDDVGEEPSSRGAVSVSFLPRLRDLPKRCPQCFSTMTECLIWLDIQGHGSVVAPPLHVRFESPGTEPIDRFVGNESFQFRRQGLCCSQCGSSWFPPARAGSSWFPPTT